MCCSISLGTKLQFPIPCFFFSLLIWSTRMCSSCHRCILCKNILGSQHYVVFCKKVSIRYETFFYLYHPSPLVVYQTHFGFQQFQINIIIHRTMPLVELKSKLWTWAIIQSTAHQAYHWVLTSRFQDTTIVCWCYAMLHAITISKSTYSQLDYIFLPF